MDPQDQILNKGFSLHLFRVHPFPSLCLGKGCVSWATIVTSLVHIEYNNKAVKKVDYGLGHLWPWPNDVKFVFEPIHLFLLVVIKDKPFPECNEGKELIWEPKFNLYDVREWNHML